MEETALLILVMHLLLPVQFDRCKENSLSSLLYTEEVASYRIYSQEIVVGVYASGVKT